MTLAYEKLLKSHPEIDPKSFSKELNQKIKSLKHLKGIVEGKRRINQAVTPITLQKIRQYDEEIVDELLDFDLLDDQESEPPTEDFSDDSEDQDDFSENEELDEDTDFDDPENLVTGQHLDSVFTEMLDSGQTEFTISQLKSIDSKIYEVLFDSYENDSENGIETSNFTLIETAPNSETFKLSTR